MCLPRRKRSSFWSSCSSRLILLLKWELWMILFSAEAILASSTSKFCIEIPREDDEDINSSTESTNSTSFGKTVSAAPESMTKSHGINLHSSPSSVLPSIFPLSRGHKLASFPSSRALSLVVADRHLRV